MPFGFGGGSSSSQSSGSSSSFDISQSESASGGFSRTGSDQRIAFEDIFARLFGGAESAAAGLDPSMLTEAANQLFGAGTDFLSRIGGDKGTAFLEDRLSADNEVLDEQIDLLGEDLGRFFREELNPAITSEAVGGGTLGGGRQGVAQGAASGAVTSEFRRGATALRAGDIAARDRAASILADQNLAGIQAGLSGLPALAGIADMGFSAALAPFERLSAILGDPTTLTSSFGNAADFARAFSSSFGTSQSQTQSTSRSRDFSIGFG